MPIIDLSLAIKGTSIPIDYGYALFSALSRIVPNLHGDRRIGVHPIRGIREHPKRLTLVRQSRLRLRMPLEEISTYLALVGNEIDLEGSRLMIGFPPIVRGTEGRRHAEEAVRVEPLCPSAELSSRLVTLGKISEPAAFEESLRRQLDGLGVAAEPGFLPSTDPRGRGGPERRVLRIKGRAIVGFPIRISGLTAEESLIVQENGLGSRRRMSCGLFVPVPSRRTPGTDPGTVTEA
jgi:CRISPR-associated protein Cas6